MKDEEEFGKKQENNVIELFSRTKKRVREQKGTMESLEWLAQAAIFQNKAKERMAKKRQEDNRRITRTLKK